MIRIELIGVMYTVSSMKYINILFYDFTIDNKSINLPRTLIDETNRNRINKTLTKSLIVML